MLVKKKGKDLVTGLTVIKFRMGKQKKQWRICALEKEKTITR
jgi:hypothetical protein